MYGTEIPQVLHLPLFAFLILSYQMGTLETQDLDFLKATREFIYCCSPIGVIRPFREKPEVRNKPGVRDQPGVRNHTNYWVMAMRIEGKDPHQQHRLKETDVQPEVLNRMKTIMDKLFVGYLSVCRALAKQ
jgi:hypothetical protein